MCPYGPPTRLGKGWLAWLCHVPKRTTRRALSVYTHHKSRTHELLELRETRPARLNSFDWWLRCISARLESGWRRSSFLGWLNWLRIEPVLVSQPQFGQFMSVYPKWSVKFDPCCSATWAGSGHKLGPMSIAFESTRFTGQIGSECNFNFSKINMVRFLIRTAKFMISTDT